MHFLFVISRRFTVPREWNCKNGLFQKLCLEVCVISINRKCDSRLGDVYNVKYRKLQNTTEELYPKPHPIRNFDPFTIPYSISPQPISNPSPKSIPHLYSTFQRFLISYFSSSLESQDTMYRQIYQIMFR